MDNQMILLIVSTECEAGVETQFNKWYDEVHIPLLLKFKGIKAASRHSVQNVLSGKKERAKYIACYQFENKKALDDYLKSPELAAAMEEMEDTWKDGGFIKKGGISYETINYWDNSNKENVSSIQFSL